MNDEQDKPDVGHDERRGSRWAVPAGSVSNDVTFRRPESMDEPDQVTRRRPSEIIREVRDDAGKAAAAAADTPRRSRSSVTPSVDDEPIEVHPISPRRSPLYDESRRVEPDLGQKRELRAVTGGSSSSLVMAGFGGVILIMITALIGAILDYLFTDRLGALTAIGLTLGAAAAAFVTRKRDLVSVMVAPPLIYALIAAVVLLVGSRGFGVTVIADTAIRGFPAMALATGLATVIAGARLIFSRVGERR